MYGFLQIYCLSSKLPPGLRGVTIELYTLLVLHFTQIYYIVEIGLQSKFQVLVISFIIYVNSSVSMANYSAVYKLYISETIFKL